MRYLEIHQREDGQWVAFHEPGPDSPFSTGAAVPPTEVLFCDCIGVGRICHHTYAGNPAHKDEAMHEDRHMSVAGPGVLPQPQDEWKRIHSGPRCGIRRQFFVDVTDRPDAQLGMIYDEKTDTFSAPKKV